MSDVNHMYLDESGPISFSHYEVIHSIVPNSTEDQPLSDPSFFLSFHEYFFTPEIFLQKFPYRKFLF